MPPRVFFSLMRSGRTTERIRIGIRVSFPRTKLGMDGCRDNIAFLYVGTVLLTGFCAAYNRFVSESSVQWLLSWVLLLSPVVRMGENEGVTDCPSLFLFLRLRCDGFRAASAAATLRALIAALDA